MEKGADIYSRNHNGSNVLHIAIKKNNKKVIMELLKIKYPLNIIKNNGVTAAGIAAFKGNLELLQLLTEAGADLHLTSKNGIGPLYLAIKSN